MLDAHAIIFFFAVVCNHIYQAKHYIHTRLIYKKEVKYLTY